MKIILLFTMLFSVFPLSGESSELPPLVLNFTGDLMAHPPNFRMSDFGRIYDAVEHHFQFDDLSFTNLEFVVDPDREMAGYPRFNVHPDYVEAAIQAGFDVFALANNHTTDYGAAGVGATAQSMEALADSWGYRGRNLYYSGIRSGENERFEVERIEHNGWEIGFLSVAAFSNWPQGTDGIYLVNYWDQSANEELLNFIRAVRDQFDLFILSYHSGTEYVLEPTPAKARIMQNFVEAGVDIVWGHHPHVLQPIELVERRDGRNAVIMYSMGNFISSQPIWLRPDEWDVMRAYTGDSVIAELHVEMSVQGPHISGLQPYMITHLREYETDDPLRDGYEVHYTQDTPHIARDIWKEFYQVRLNDMLSLIGRSSVRYYLENHPVP